MRAAIATCLAISLIAGVKAQEATADPDPTVGEQTGTIVFYRRASLAGLANACPVRHKGEEVVELGRGKVFKWQVKPGRYILENKTSSVEVSVDPGETRYVRCQMKTGILTYRADLQIVDGTEYDELKDEFESPGS